MTTIDATPKLTHLKVWYKGLELSKKGQAIELIKQAMTTPASYRTVENWVAGRSTPKSEDGLQALSKVTGIARDMLFEYVA